MGRAHEELDYEQVVKVFQLLTDIRFKLIAFVPTLAAAAIALSTKAELDAVQQSALGALGFLATLGIVFYEQRNAQLYNNAIGRARVLEKEMGLLVSPGDEAGGYFSSRTETPRKLFGIIPMRHDRGLGLVYGAALGGWIFVATAVLPDANFRVLLASSVGILFFLEFERLDRRSRRGSDAVPFAYKNRKDTPGETVYELTTSADEPEWGIAVADIAQSQLHVHRRTREIYTVVDGSIQLTLGSETLTLEGGQVAEIAPGTEHSARSLAPGRARVVVITVPAWTADDHVLLDVAPTRR